MNIKVNDNVLVITGKYKGRQGKVLKTDPKNNTVIVEGINLVHKHEKAKKADQTSRIVTEEAPIDVSNVEIVCPGCGKPTRVYHAFVDGKKVRIHGGAKGCGASLDKEFAKKVKGGKAAEPAPQEEAPKKRTRKRTQKTEEVQE